MRADDVDVTAPEAGTVPLGRGAIRPAPL